MKKQKDYEFCKRCGKQVYRYPSKRLGEPFCSRQCHMLYMNEKMNPTRMTPDTRSKIRQALLDTGEGKSYRKLFGRHEHRVVAEQMLGRPLKKREVVHHIDGNKRNNAPENLMVFKNQKEHAAWHCTHDNFLNRKEVVPK